MVSTSPSLAARLSELFAPGKNTHVRVAWLFGSHAEGRAHRDSDVDVGILLDFAACPTDRERFDAGVRCSSWLASELGHPLVDVVVLNDAPPTLAARVVTTGCLVYCADAEVEHAFRRDVQLRAADLVPYLRRTSEIKRSALAR